MRDKKRIVKIATIFLVVIFVGILTLFVYKNPIAHARLVLQPQSAVSRLEYWRQAMEGLKERPVFGHGAGTFSLVSIRFQKTQGSASWFAHSEPLQIAAELGLVGVIAFLWLYFVHAQLFGRARSQTKHFQIRRVLIASVFLTLGYSLFEFTLDYFVLWLLFWATVGILTRKMFDGDSTKQYNENSIQICLFVVGIFYFLWVVSNAVSLVTKRYDTAFYIAPFDLVTASAMLATKDADVPSSSAIDLLLFFHRQNPKVLFGVAQKQPSDVISCEQFVLLDKKNSSFQDECMKLLFTNNNMRGVGALLYLLGQNTVPKKAQWRLSLNDFTNQYVAEQFVYESVHKFFFSAQNKEYGFSKFMYALGLRVVADDPQLTRRLWLLARDVSPGWSFFHVELASLDAWVFGDMAAAKKRLTGCAQLQAPRAHCLYELSHAISPVGSQKIQIAAIQ